MTTIQWGLFKESHKLLHEGLELAYFPPEPVLPYILANRNPVKANAYTQCPAFLDYYRNVYVIKSPFDIKLNIDAKTGYMHIFPQAQEFYDTFLLNRSDAVGEGDPFLFSLSIFYLFAADKECVLEEIPVTFHDSPLNSKLRVISGTFDISKWFRPVEIAFEVLDKNDTISIRRGDPLVYIRFIPAQGKKVYLENKPFTSEQIKAVYKCTTLKECVPKQPLEVLYKYAEKLKPLFSRKKCPFNWSKK